MRNNHIFLLTMIAVVAVACTSSHTNQIVADNAELELVSNQFSFTEGPIADSTGNVYFTDQPNNKIYRYTIDGNLEVFLEDAGRANGLYFDAEGILWACADEFNQLWIISKEKEPTVVLNLDSLASFNGPNDIWIHEKGFVYFTDPMYQRPYWHTAHDTLKYQGLYTLNGSGEAILSDSSLVQPNGIVGDSKNNLLYVADIGAGKTYQYELLPDGSLSTKRLFVEKGSDGMTLDDKGNLYLTGEGVDVFDSEGAHLCHIDVPEKWTANVCFGGAKLDHLFITASKSLYKIKTNMKRIR
jgi:gluconolactonase